MAVRSSRFNGRVPTPIAASQHRTLPPTIPGFFSFNTVERKSSMPPEAIASGPGFHRACCRDGGAGARASGCLRRCKGGRPGLPVFDVPSGTTAGTRKSAAVRAEDQSEARFSRLTAGAFNTKTPVKFEPAGTVGQSRSISQPSFGLSVMPPIRPATPSRPSDRAYQSPR